MTNRWRSASEEALDGCLDAVGEAERALTVALAAADVVDAVELAERVEQLARLVYRLQVRAAGAVEAESPAVRRSDPPPEAPFRRGCDLLRTRLRISGREASRRIRAAGSVLPRSALSGAELAPLAPVLATGLGTTGGVGDREVGTGDLAPTSSAHLARTPGGEALDVVLRTLEDVRAVAEAGVLAEAEQTLVTYAATFDPDTLRRVGRRLLSLLDPDGVEPCEGDLARRQGVTVGATWRGLTHLDIWADAVQTEVLLTVLDTGSNPRVAGREVPERVAADVDRPTGPTDRPSRTGGAAGAPTDDRTRGQRMLDALVGACQAALRTARLPVVAGLPPQLVVTMDVDDLRQRLAASPGAAGRDPDADGDEGSIRGRPPSTGRTGPGAAPPGDTGWGRAPHAGPVPVALLRRLACDADVIPVVLGGAGEVMDVGRARRLVPTAMRRVLIARDGGCIFPGCTIPATWTEGHHVIPWSRGGPTSLANTTLLCAAHHHAVHSGRWVVEPSGAPEGAAATPAGSAFASWGSAQRPFRVTAPWAARAEQTWNAYPLGA